MGKRTINLTGVARFAVSAFSSDDIKSRHLPLSNFQDSTTTDAPVQSAELADGKTDSRPTKKRKTGFLGAGWEKYDATELVSHYTHISEVPTHLHKYFSQRKRLFSLYSEGCLLDEEGWYSVTPERMANQIAERCRCDTILDAFCGVGGNAIAFARTCERVIALDTSPTRLALARHNAVIYGVADRIEFILGDYLSFARSYLSLPSPEQRKIDVVFLSPPWGGPEYLSGSTIAPDSSILTPPNGDEEQQHPNYTLASIQPIHGAELFCLSRRISRNIAYFLPRNTDLLEISDLLCRENLTGGEYEGSAAMKTVERVEVEEEWMGRKLKALTCYFGGLVSGQGDMF